MPQVGAGLVPALFLHSNIYEKGTLKGHPYDLWLQLLPVGLQILDGKHSLEL